MIYIRPSGCYFRLGLNICFGQGHIAVHWVWYDIGRHECSQRGFTVSRRGFRRTAARWNVINEHLRLNNSSAVNNEVLRDMLAAEESSMRRNERFAIIKPEPRA